MEKGASGVTKAEKEKENGKNKDKKDKDQLCKKCGRQFAFFLVSFCVQFFAAVLCVTLLAWAIFQSLTTINALGVSDTPPGLIHYAPP